MYMFLMILFIVVCIILSFFVLLQQGKGDFGSALGGGTQMLFGGSGGQSFFEKITWVLGALFVLGALGLSILRSREERTSVLEGYKKVATAPAVPAAKTAVPASKPTAQNDEFDMPAALPNQTAPEANTKA